MSAFLTIFPTALNANSLPQIPKHSASMDFTTLIGLAAAFCTTVSYYPQLKKCWETGSAGILSLKMFLTLATGVALLGGLWISEERCCDHHRERRKLGAALWPPLLQAAGAPDARLEILAIR